VYSVICTGKRKEWLNAEVFQTLKDQCKEKWKRASKAENLHILKNEPDFEFYQKTNYLKDK
jgi:hypothetical protein